MRVFFIAVGDSRRRAVLDEAADVIRDGGTATILLGNPARWSGEVFPDGVTVIAASDLDKEDLPLRLERLLVFGVPYRILKVAGRGPLRPRARRAWKAYERRFAKPVHRRAVAKYARIWPDRRHRQVTARVISGGFDYVNVTDYLSMPVGARILADLESGAESSAKLSFGIDYVK